MRLPASDGTIEPGRQWLPRRHLLFAVVLVLLAFFHLDWASTDQIGFLGGDGPNYLMLADHFTPYGEKDPVYDAVGQVSRFPPVYSALLGVFDASMNLHRAHWITALCLLFALVAYYSWLLGERFSPPQATLLVLILAVLPETLHVALAIQSEYLYLALSLVALILLRRFERARSRELLYMAAAVIAVTILTREVGLSLLLPLLVCAWRHSKRSVLWALAIAMVPVVDWHQFHQAPNSYDKILLGYYHSGGVSALKQQLVDEFAAMVDGFDKNFDFSGGFKSLALTIGSICLLGTLWRAVRLRLDALYVLANLAILLVWPYPEEAARFIWVLVPLLLLQMPLLLAEIRAESPAGVVPGAVLALLSAAVLTMALPPVLFVTGIRQQAAFETVPGAGGYNVWYVPDRSDAHYGVGFESTVIQALRDVQAFVPPGDCIMAARPDIVSYFSRRHSFFLPEESVPDQEFEQALRAQGCHYVFAYGVGDQRYNTLMYPSKRIGGFSEELMAVRRNNAPLHVLPMCRLYRLK